MKAKRPREHRRGAGSSVLRLLGMVVVSVLVYAVWLDLMSRPSPWRHGSPAGIARPWEPPAAHELAGRSDRPPEAARTRLIDIVVPPDGTLAMIQDALNKGNLSETARLLRQLESQNPSGSGEAYLVGALWNNLGVRQEARGRIETALEAFGHALAHSPASPEAHLNLAYVYREMHAPALTHAFLERVVRLNPREPLPRILLAELLLAKGDREAALRQLQAGAVRTAEEPTLRSYAESLLAQARQLGPRVASLGRTSGPGREMTVPESVRESDRRAESSGELPGKPRARPTLPESNHPEQAPKDPVVPEFAAGRDHFSVKFIGQEDQEAWESIRAILEYAYRDIGAKLGHHPIAPVEVVLHPDEEFLDLAGSPTWADMLYDVGSGEIHLPLQGALNDLARLSRVVRHEYVHAMLRNMVGARIEEVPTWLLEGLALHLAEDLWPEVEAVRSPPTGPIPLTTLEKPWSHVPRPSLPQAYLEAALATKVLVDRHSLRKIDEFISSVATRSARQRTLPESLALTDEQFQRRWKQKFGVKQSAARP